MKKWLALGVLGIAALSTFAATCVVTNTRLTTIGDKDVFAGQLKNETGADFLQHNFLVAFIDEDNNLVETKSVGGCLRSLQDGATNYFSATSTSNANDIASALSRLALDGTLKAGEVAEGDLVFSDVRIRRQGNQLKVSGNLRNNENEKVFDPAVCVVVKDDDGRILLVGKTSAIADLNEDDTDDFALTLTVLDNVDAVDSVSVFADGLVGSASGTPVEPVADEDNDVALCASATSTPAATATPDPTATATATATPTPCF